MRVVRDNVGPIFMSGVGGRCIHDANVPTNQPRVEQSLDAVRVPQHLTHPGKTQYASRRRSNASPDPAQPIAEGQEGVTRHLQSAVGEGANGDR
jgi:hypothetical protein